MSCWGRGGVRLGVLIVGLSYAVYLVDNIENIILYFYCYMYLLFYIIYYVLYLFFYIIYYVLYLFFYIIY